VPQHDSIVPSVHCVDSVEHGKFDAQRSGERMGMIGGNDRLLIGIKLSPLEVYVGKGVFGGGATVGDHVINCRVSSLDTSFAVDCNSSSFLAVARCILIVVRTDISSRRYLYDNIVDID